MRKLIGADQAKEDVMSLPLCPYCADPALLRTDFSSAPYARKEVALLIKHGQFWLKELKNSKSSTISVDAAVWSKDAQECFVIDSRLFQDEQRAKVRWRDFRVEMLGLKCTEEPPSPPSPLFIRLSRPQDWTIWCACRIEHKDSGLRVLVHWWESHEWQFQVEGYDFERGETREVLKKALGFFEVGRGRPRDIFTTNRKFIRALNAFILLPEIKSQYERGVLPTAADAAAKLGMSETDLRRWLDRWWQGKPWPDIARNMLETLHGKRDSRVPLSSEAPSEEWEAVEQNNHRFEVIRR